MMSEAPINAMSWIDALRDYPRELVLGGAVVLAVALWFVLAKVLKWALYVGLFGVLVLFLVWLAWSLDQ